MQVGVGYSDSPDSAIAGKQAAQSALERAGRQDACDMVFLFGAAPHNQEILRQAVAEETQNTDRIYGGGTVGVITNETFGYAGDQVGVACFWLEGVECDVLLDDGLLESEEETGIRLGKRLAEQGIHADSPAMLFYDAFDRSAGDVRMIMATWLLAGLEKGLGFLPDLTGAGLMGDHICSPTRQFIGDKIGDHYAMALAFDDNVRIDSAIMHGCRPASGYYTVTKAEGPVILEINGEPAIPFIDKQLDGAVTPEQYPFFLLFGLNNGDRWGEYDENNYASRLCLGIAPEINGIVMFEPDMVPGTEFQLMIRSLDLHYMKPKIEEVFENLGDREPVFAMYIDCAGRCAGYGGIDIEDAVVLQETVAGRVPLLGLYTGVEIAAIGGKPRGLDWTGVFVLFSTGKDGAKPEPKVLDQEVWETRSKTEADESASLEAMSKLAVQNAAKALELDSQSIAIRQELEQKRRGFSLLAELAVSMRQTTDYQSVLAMVTQRINAALHMQKTIVLMPDREDRFSPAIMQGYSREDEIALEKKRFVMPEEFLDSENPLLVTGADDEGLYAELRAAWDLPFFVAAPVIVKNEVAAILITGRVMEAMPYNLRLSRSDMETVQAIGVLLSTVLVYQRLDMADRKARLDVLTGLYNRNAYELEVANHLENDIEDRMYAFLMVDIDHFKSVNDTYGHMQGDIVLKALANTLRENFRSTDVVARLGGDEFAVFCPAIGKIEQVISKVEHLQDMWRDLVFTAEDGTKFKTTLSIGISIAPRDGCTYNELFQKADIALYKSKQNGRDRHTIYDV